MAWRGDTACGQAVGRQDPAASVDGNGLRDPLVYSLCLTERERDKKLNPRASGKRVP